MHCKWWCVHLVVPLPGLRVDGLSHGAQDAQGRARVLGHKAVAERLQRADGCRRSVQQRHLHPTPLL